CSEPAIAGRAGDARAFSAARPAISGQPLRPRSVLVRVRQQRQEARPLDRGRELALIRRTRPGDTARDDLAGLGDVGLQSREILVIDLLDALCRESAKLLTA